ncbi:MAG: LarC family nickel insertion protein [Acidobacteriota bacterium]|nr:MAG: LarC family nickel insertion protein [Acidobacteriota bacterium]
MVFPSARHLHVDPFAGISGDMWLALLIDLGLAPAVLERLPERLGLSGVTVRVARTTHGAIDAARVAVDVDRSGHSRTLEQMLEVVARGDLPPRAAGRSRDAIERLFAAEAKVHGRPVESVHLHEAGGDDALIDIAGACLGLDEFGVETVSCAVPIPLGGGTVTSAHGRLPVPAPATAELLIGVPIVGGPVARELVTPTGAAILRAVSRRSRRLPR